MTSEIDQRRSIGAGPLNFKQLKTSMRSLRDMALSGELSSPFVRSSRELLGHEGEEPGRTSNDVQIYEAARFFHGYATNIMSALDKSIYRKENGKALIDLLIMYANSITSMLAKDTIAAMTNEVGEAYILGYVARLPATNGSNASSDDLFSSVIDALRFPLGYLLSISRMNSDAPNQVADETIDDIPHIIKIANAWDIAKFTWQRCLFYDYQFAQTSDGVFFNGIRDDSYFIVGRFRQIQIAMSRYMANAHADIATGRRKNMRSGRKFRRKGARIFLTKDNRSSLDLDEFVVDAFTRNYVLPTKLSKTSEITALEALSAWEVLSDISRLSLKRLGNPTELPREELTLEHLGLFDIEALTNLLATSLAVTPSKAKSIFDIIAYSGSGEFDPWSSPIINREDGTCSLLLNVLAFGNRPFVLESLMRKVGYEMTQRGKAFESFLRDELLRAKADCLYGEIMYVSDISLQLKRGSGEREEIDLLVIIGKDAYVIEAKCDLFPVDVPDEFYLTRKITDADHQLSRKIDFLRRNWTGLGACIRLSKMC